MDALDHYRKLKVDSSLERCEALTATLPVFKTRIETSPAARHVVDAVETAIQGFKRSLHDLAKDPDLQYLDEQEVEARIHLFMQYLPFLHTILGLIERADAVAVPAELSALLRRQVQRYFPTADLAVVSSTELNYSIVEVTQHLTPVLKRINAPNPEGFPDRLFVATIPSLEHDQALLHCILAHELGHAFYTEHRLKDEILPLVQIDDANIRELLNQYRQYLDAQAGDKSQPRLPFDELELRERIVLAVNELIPNWLNELAADIFAVLVFGPAYLCAFVYFSSSAGLLDNASDSHPATRLRIRLLFDVLDRHFPSDVFSSTTAAFLEAWREISRSPGVSPGVYEVASRSITQPDVKSKLYEVCLAKMNGSPAYDSVIYRIDLENLLPMIRAHIPPAEFLKDGAYKPATVPGILNAGWECYLAGYEGFRSRFQKGQEMTNFTLNTKLNKLLLKALELQEASEAWREARSATIGRGNPPADAR